MFIGPLFWPVILLLGFVDWCMLEEFVHVYIVALFEFNEALTFFERRKDLNVKNICTYLYFRIGRVTKMYAIWGERAKDPKQMKIM